MMQMLSTITAVDDLNYPEKTETYYIVNAPYVFSACWKVGARILDLFFGCWHSYIFLVNSLEFLLTDGQVVKPLLQERTKKKIKVLYGPGRDELLKVYIYS